MNRLFESILKNRWLVLLATMLFFFPAIYGLKFFEMKTDYRYYFKQDDPKLLALNRMDETYNESDTVLVLLAPKNGNVFTNKTLAQVSAMTEEFWNIPYSTRVDSLSNFQHTKAVEDTLYVDSLITDSSELDSYSIEEIRKIALGEEELVGRLISESGHVTAIAINIRLPGEEITETTEVIRAVQEIKSQYLAQNPETEIYLTGMLMGNQAGLDTIFNDNVTLVPLMGFAIIALLTMLYKSAWATLATVTILIFSLVTAFGIGAWLGLFMSSPSSSSPIVILTIAVADCVHVFITFFFALGKGLEKQDAILESLNLNWKPVAITSLTTAVGFLSLNFSEIPPFHTLGNQVAIGVTIACIASLTLLPILISWFPFKQRGEENSGEVSFMIPFAQNVVKNRKIYFVTVSALSIILSFYLTRLEINDQFVKFFDESVEFRYSTDFADRNLSSVYDMKFSLSCGQESCIYEPEYLLQVEKFAEWLRSHPEVVQVQAVTDTFKRLNRSMNGDLEEFYRVPQDRELASQYFLLYELSLPYGLDANHQVSFDKSESKILVSLKEQTTNEMLSIEKEFVTWMDDNLEDVEHFRSGVMLVFSHVGVENARSMIYGTAIALTVMSLIIGLSLTSFRLGLVSLVANMVPAVMAFGVWGLLVGQVGMAVAIAVGMTLGIVVDNAVHLLTKYSHAFENNGGEPDKSIEYAFSHVGVALLVCNSVLIAGFLILAQSSFSLNSHMAYFAATTFVLALIVDFLLLPPVLFWVDRALKR